MSVVCGGEAAGELQKQVVTDVLPSCNVPKRAGNGRCTSFARSPRFGFDLKRNKSGRRPDRHVLGRAEAQQQEGGVSRDCGVRERDGNIWGIKGGEKPNLGDFGGARQVRNVAPGGSTRHK